MKGTSRLLFGMILMVAFVAAMFALSSNASAADLNVGAGQPYATIQSAIDAASPGDTVYVHAGTYNEALTISTAKHDIRVLGPNYGTPGYGSRDTEALVRAAGTVPILRVAADNAVVAGFKFNYTGSDRAVFMGAFSTNLGETSHGTNILFSYNILEVSAVSEAAIRLERTSGCMIFGNKIVTGASYGIMVTATTGSVNYATDGNTITWNHIDKNGTAGISTAVSVRSTDGQMHDFDNTDIDSNMIYDSRNGNGFQTAISLYYARASYSGPAIEIYSNIIANGTVSTSYYQIDVNQADNVTFHDNEVITRGQRTINVQGCPYMIVSGNTMTAYAPKDHNIVISGGDETLFTFNTVVVHPDDTAGKRTVYITPSPGGDLTFYGNTIDIRPTTNMVSAFWDCLVIAGTVYTNEIEHNTFNAHGMAGQSYAITYSSGGPGKNVTITDNVFQGFPRYLDIIAQSSMNRFHIHHNDFHGTAAFAIITSTLAPEVFDARYNWWGSATGPSSSSWANGTGNYIPQGIPYQPWMSGPAGSGQAVNASSVTGVIDGSTRLTTGPSIGITVSGTGPGSVSKVGAFRFDANPGQWFSGNGLGEYYDVYAQGIVNMNSIEVRLNYTPGMLAAHPQVDEQDLIAYYSNGGAYLRCSESGANTVEHYVWARFTTSTMPTMGQLTGTMFTLGSVSVELSSSYVLAGQRVQVVTAGGFDPYSPLSVVWDDEVHYVQMVTNATGSLARPAYFMIPQALPGTHTLQLQQISGSANVTVEMTVVDSSPLIVTIDVGSQQFRGQDARFTTVVTLNGDLSDAWVRAGLVMPNDTMVPISTESISQVGKGIYRIHYRIPVDAPLGEYALVVSAEGPRNNGSSVSGFSISVNLTGLQANVVTAILADLHPIVTDIRSDIVTIKTDVGSLKVTLEQLDAKVVSLNGSVATLSTSLGTLTGNVTSVDGKVANIQTSVGNVQAEVSSVQSKANGIDAMMLIVLLVTVIMSAIVIMLVFLRTKR